VKPCGKLEEVNPSLCDYDKSDMNGYTTHELLEELLRREIARKKYHDSENRV
jgi:hypothetical protein